jgi:hypothetical protein
LLRHIEPPNSDNEICIGITDVPYETTRQYTAFAPDNRPEAETVKIKVYSDIK